jgi:hypothetical protein
MRCKAGLLLFGARHDRIQVPWQIKKQMQVFKISFPY